MKTHLHKIEEYIDDLVSVQNSIKEQYNNKCMNQCKSHNGGTILMSGTWKVHEGLIHRIYPYGLHREFYQVIDNDADIFSEDNLKFIKIRNSNRLHRL